MPKFKELSFSDLLTRINNSSGLSFPIAYSYPGGGFCGINPQLAKITNQIDVQSFQEKYKKHKFFPGQHTQHLKKIKEDPEKMKNAALFLKDNALESKVPGQYQADHGALKLHVSLNNIAELDQEVVIGLINMLVKDGLDEENDYSFDFKIINPQNATDERFGVTDQLTIYFNKYSSIGSLNKLAEKIESYLIAQGVEKNKISLGPKDVIGLNSFVSARTDIDKVNKQYMESRFFDLELKSFFEKHKNDNMLKDAPLCGLEAVYNDLITTQKPILNEDGTLSEKDSRYVQNHLNMMVSDPVKYMQGTTLGQKFEEFMATHQVEVKGLDKILANKDAQINVKQKGVNVVGEKLLNELKGLLDASGIFKNKNEKEFHASDEKKKNEPDNSRDLKK